MLHCPTCQKIISWEGNVFRPFCSERCRQIDLQGWFDERYRIPQEEGPDSDHPHNFEEPDNTSFLN